MRGGQIARFLRLDLRLDHRAEGGALIDLRDGRAFGMAVYGPRGSVLGIPMETIERVAERLLAHGRIGRGYLGLGLRPVRLDEETVRRLGLAKPYGLMVVSVEVDGPAHKAPAPPSDEPQPKAQRNFTDPDSRVLLTKDGYIQGYNPQAAVDGEAQIIVAHTLTSSMSDHGQLVPLLDGIQANLGRRPREASADSGYLSEANLASLEARVIKAYIATGRAKHPADVKRKIGGPLTQGMRRKLKRAGWRSRYRLRKQIVEPVFGQIKQARGFRQFLLRGIDAVAAEWAMICTAHNLTKLARAT
jgi:hypothetical protein